MFVTLYVLSTGWQIIDDHQVAPSDELLLPCSDSRYATLVGSKWIYALTAQGPIKRIPSPGLPCFLFARWNKQGDVLAVGDGNAEVCVWKRNRWSRYRRAATAFFDSDDHLTFVTPFSERLEPQHVSGPRLRFKAVKSNGLFEDGSFATKADYQAFSLEARRGFFTITLKGARVEEEWPDILISRGAGEEYLISRNSSRDGSLRVVDVVKPPSKRYARVNAFTPTVFERAWWSGPGKVTCAAYRGPWRYYIYDAPTSTCHSYQPKTLRVMVPGGKRCLEWTGGFGEGIRAVSVVSYTR